MIIFTFISVPTTTLCTQLLVLLITPADGTTRTEPLLRESVKAYLGEVIDPQFSDVRLREDAAGVAYSAFPEAELGWARIMIHDQGDDDRPSHLRGRLCGGWRRAPTS